MRASIATILSKPSTIVVPVLQRLIGEQPLHDCEGQSAGTRRQFHTPGARPLEDVRGPEARVVSRDKKSYDNMLGNAYAQVAISTTVCLAFMSKCEDVLPSAQRHYRPVS